MSKPTPLPVTRLVKRVTSGDSEAIYTLVQISPGSIMFPVVCNDGTAWWCRFREVETILLPYHGISGGWPTVVSWEDLADMM